MHDQQQGQQERVGGHESRAEEIEPARREVEQDRRMPVDPDPGNAVKIAINIQATMRRRVR